MIDECSFGAVRDGDLVCVEKFSHEGVEVGRWRWSWMENLKVCFYFISIVLVENLVDRGHFLKERARVKRRKQSHVNARTGCPEIAYDSAIVQKAHQDQYQFFKFGR